MGLRRFKMLQDLRSKKIKDCLVGRLFRSRLSSPVSISVVGMALEYGYITPNCLRCQKKNIYTHTDIHIHNTEIYKICAFVSGSLLTK